MNKTTIQHIDLFPTFQSLAGAKLPPQKLHGRNIHPLLKGQRGFHTERDIFWYLPGYSAFHKPSLMVRRGKWKLVRRLDVDESELFNTDHDIGESKDLSKAEPELTSSLNQAAVTWLDALNAPRMKPNPEFDPAFGHR